MRASMMSLVLLAGCARSEAPNTAGLATPKSVPAPHPAVVADPVWRLRTDAAGAALVHDGAGVAALRILCPVPGGTVVVHVPGFGAIGSEERLSFGQGGAVETLVVAPSGNATGGVTGRGPVPTNLHALLSGAVSVTYGAQVSGPHAPPPPALVSAFVAACEAGGASRAPQSTIGSTAVGACRTQDGHAIAANRMRAVGTEPFWGASVEGRCVTYSHPGDATGTRVWTRFEGTVEQGAWSGALHGAPFVMRTRPAPGCSDGMSDRRYPIAVSLTVGDEERRGCAEAR
ncbi:hypothetical protein PAGU2595_010530 [Lysobacter xanthus]